MADRTVRVILEAVTGGYESAMKRAAALTSSTADAISSAGDNAKGMGREIMEASKTDAWRTMGTQALVAGAAIGGVVVAVGKTGVEYNTLQQTSRAALKTILGGTEEVNKQMGKLDEFAKTSPFGKDIFIKAQQEMLAFGIETEDVIPYLDSLNEAVAAAGGGGQQLGELATIMAQISSSAKITSTDLDMFGERGINAAELIGAQMGVTGSAIRDQITAGTLDADDALHALSAGMKETFDGASANVKNTMAGAFDRVKAGWRDLSASIMSGAVDPEGGGGWLVGTTNKLADLLRLAEKAPQPLQDTALAVAGIGAAGLIGLGGVMKITTAFAEFRESQAFLMDTMPRMSRAIGTAGRVAGGAAIAFGAMRVIGLFGEKVNEHVVDVDTMTNSLVGMKDASSEVQKAGLDRFFRDAEDPTRRLAAGVDDLGNAFRQIEARETSGVGFFLQLDNMVKSAFGVKSEVKLVDEAMQNLDLTLASMDPVTAGGYFKHVAEEAKEFGRSTEDWLTDFPVSVAAVTDALADASDENFTYAATAENVASILTGELPDGLVFTEEGIKKVSAAMEEGLTAFDMTGKELMEYDGGMIAVTEHQKEFAAGVAEAAASFGNFLGAFAEANALAAEAEVPMNLDLFSEQLDNQLDTLVDWETNVLSLSGRVSDGFLDHLMSMGVEGAELVKLLSTATNDELAKIDAQFALTEEGAKDFGLAVASTKEDLDTSAAGMVNLAEKMGAAGLSIEQINGFMSSARAEFVQAAIDMGYGADEANRMATAAGLIPNSIVTEFTAEGIELSTTQIDSLNEQLQDIPPEKRAEIVTIAHTEGATAAQTAIDAIKEENEKKVVTSYDSTGVDEATDAMHSIEDAVPEIKPHFQPEAVDTAESRIQGVQDKDAWVFSNYDPFGEHQAKSGLDSVQDKNVTISADGSQALSEARRVAGAINSMTASITVRATVVGGGRGISIPGGFTGGLGADIARRGFAGGGLGGSSFPYGGLLSGPGTSTSDSIPAMLSTKEYIVRAASVDRIGVHRLDHINRTGTMPTFRDGGQARAVTGNLSTANRYGQQAPSVTNIYKIEGREAHALLIDLTRDSVRNDYQTNGVHRG